MRTGPGQRGRPHPPGPDDLAEPDHDHRPADRRGGAAPPGRQPNRGPDPGPRGPRHGRDAPARGAARPVPPRAVGRTAPAGDDRHGPGLRAEAADRRRADHRPRRHHPGPDPRPDRRPAPAPAHGRDPDHPRHGGDRRPDRPGGGHVRRQDRRGGRRPASCSSGCATPTPRRCWPRCPRSTRTATSAAVHPGPAPGPVHGRSPAAGSPPAASTPPTECRAEEPAARPTTPTVAPMPTASPASTRWTPDAGRSRCRGPTSPGRVGARASARPRHCRAAAEILGSTTWSRSSRSWPAASSAQGGHGQGGVRRHASPSAGARPSAWSASRAAARRPSVA